MTVTWTEAAQVAIKRGLTEDGHEPYMLRQQIASGDVRGRRFEISINVASGHLLVRFEGTASDAARIYAVSPHDVVSAILASDPAISPL